MPVGRMDLGDMGDGADGDGGIALIQGESLMDEESQNVLSSNKKALADRCVAFLSVVILSLLIKSAVILSMEHSD
jgi:hypothetical protein